MTFSIRSAETSGQRCRAASMKRALSSGSISIVLQTVENAASPAHSASRSATRCSSRARRSDMARHPYALVSPFTLTASVPAGRYKALPEPARRGLP